MPRKIGYARVSTAEQSLDLQIAALERADCAEIYSDKGISGCQRSRPAFDKVMEEIKAGDTLIIWRLDRMGRSLKHLMDINECLIAKGAYFESLTEKIDTSTPMGEFVFHILGAVAQLEREIIRERTLAGMAAAADHGRYPGRPRSLTIDQIIHAGRAFLDGASYQELADRHGISTETVRRYLRAEWA
jgi:Enterobacteriaceae phage serine recombinase